MHLGNLGQQFVLKSKKAFDEIKFVRYEIEDTSKFFATDMLVLKFIQGLPIVGVVGGVFNPVYYNKIMNYIRLKYHKRYSLDKLNTI